MPWRLLKLSALLLLLVIPAAALYLLVSAIQTVPLVADAGSMHSEDVGRIKNTLQQHDPRQLRDGERRSLQITERDLNLMLNSALPYGDRQQWLVELDQSQADISLSLNLPANPLGDYLNISARLRQEGPRIAVEQLRLGDTALPGWLFNPVMRAAHNILRQQVSEYGDLLNSVEQLQIGPQSLQVEYRWQAGLAERIQARGRDLFLPEADRERILAYYDETVRQSHVFAGAKVSLDRLLQPLFTLALQRSRATGEPAAENRALLLALGLVVRGSSIKHLTGESNDASALRPAPLNLTLQGRRDLAQHFTISAAIAAAGGSGLADAIGVFKEVDDSRAGSGFSFADLLADRAGVSLAETANGNRAGAVQLYFSNGPRESGYMPGFSQLPEGLMDLEFKSRFEDLDSASYALIHAEIERRIGACEVHRL